MALQVIAQARKQQGTGASRRLRRNGKVPGIIYGGKKDAVTIEVDHNALFHALRNEKFHASILDLDLDGVKEQVLLRAVNMHPFRVQVQHIDFQRVSADEKIHMKVPLHFINGENSPAVKLSGGLISHSINELEIRCLPKDLPEYIEVDLAEMTIGHTIHVTNLKLAAGVEVAKGMENLSVATASIPRAAIAEEEAAAAQAAEAAAAPAAGDVPAAKQKEPAAAAAGGDKKDDKGGKK